MRVLSVNVGLPREVDWHGKRVLTSIWKSPVAGAVNVGPVNLEGDRQSDLTVHGGPQKSVYVYPSEHYAAWRQELPAADLAWGAFGENLTIDGLLEHEVRPGDRLRIGSAEFEVTVPRLPCFKLGIRFGDDRMIRRFAMSGRSGFYLTVISQGALQAGDEIAFDPRAQDDVTIADLFAERLQ